MKAPQASETPDDSSFDAHLVAAYAGCYNVVHAPVAQKDRARLS